LRCDISYGKDTRHVRRVKDAATLAALRRLRKRALDAQYELLMAGVDAPSAANELIGAVTDARVAAEAGRPPGRDRGAAGARRVGRRAASRTTKARPTR